MPVVLVEGGATVRTLVQAGSTRPLLAPGGFVVLDPGTAHVIAPGANGAQVMEVEVRRPR